LYTLIGGLIGENEESVALVISTIVGTELKASN
jgi:hypothetical protein